MDSDRAIVDDSMEAWREAFLLALPMGGRPSQRRTLLAPIDRVRSSTQAVWVWDQLARCDYRPGWEWELSTVNPMTAGVMPLALVTTFRVPDARVENPDKQIAVRSWNLIDDHILLERNETLFMPWLAEVMLGIEHHESREWLRRDDRVWDDPHAPIPAVKKEVR